MAVEFQDFRPREAYSTAWRCAAVRSTSPFYPEQALPEELLYGREAEIDLLENRGMRTASEGRQAAFFLRGGRGLGKSSLVRYVERMAAARYNFVPVHVSLSGVRTETDIGAAVLEGISRTVGTWHDLFAMLSRYVRRVGLFGVVEIDFEAVRQDAPVVARPERVAALLERLREEARAAGVLLALDEIEDASREPWLAGYLKTLWESDATVVRRLPLVLCLCGTLADHEFLRRGHPSVPRMWSVVEVGPLAPSDGLRVLEDGFARAGIVVDRDELSRLVSASLGHPAALQMLGNLAFWRSRGAVGEREVSQALLGAPAEITLKFLPGEVGSLPEDALRALARVFASRAFASPVAADAVEPVLGELAPLLTAPLPAGRLAVVDPMLEVYTALRLE
ncbi:MAG: ATP-binding protein [Firmicutes bacterium]|nr:ATP-binding protein [Bacillota bacterium]